VADITIYHNPRCSKSREALALIEAKGHTAKVVEYLKTPLNEKQIKELVSMLGVAPKDIVRTKEDAYKTAKLSAQSSDAEVIKAIVKHPVLLERPIVVKGKKAIIGRPPEAIKPLL
jgi:arsenate reductase